MQLPNGMWVVKFEQTFSWDAFIMLTFEVLEEDLEAAAEEWC